MDKPTVGQWVKWGAIALYIVVLFFAPLGVPLALLNIDWIDLKLFGNYGGTDPNSPERRNYHIARILTTSILVILSLGLIFTGVVVGLQNHYRAEGFQSGSAASDAKWAAKLAAIQATYTSNLNNQHNSDLKAQATAVAHQKAQDDAYWKAIVAQAKIDAANNALTNLCRDVKPDISVTASFLLVTDTQKVSTFCIFFTLHGQNYYYTGNPTVQAMLFPNMTGATITRLEGIQMQFNNEQQGVSIGCQLYPGTFNLMEKQAPNC